MAVSTAILSEVQRRTLGAVCDTFVPSIDSGSDDQTMREYLARSASDLGVSEQLQALMGESMVPEEIQGFAELLDGLAEHDFAHLPLDARTQILHDVAGSAHDARLAV